MVTKTLLAGVICAAVSWTCDVNGQTAAIPSNTIPSNTVRASAWRHASEAVGTGPIARTAAISQPDSNIAPSATTPSPTTPLVTDPQTLRRPIARVSEGNGTLPNKHGQVWREYDITPYTLRVTSTKRPEQAIIDWVLRETGYEVWHGEPLGILSATRRTLRVYHTPEKQAIVADLVDRFVSSEAETCNFSLRVVTVNHPNWRAKAKPLLHPVPVQTAGTAAWLLEKEDGAILLAQLQRRSDYREHSSPRMMVNNGQSTMVTATRSRTYLRDVSFRGDAWLGVQAEPGQIDEGFSLEFSPLLTTDGRTIDAVVKCDITQVEKMIGVAVDAPTPAAPRQRMKIEVPQIAHFRYHERFRWPADKVLVVGMGMVPLPVPVDSKSLLAGLPLVSSAPRADLLVFIERKEQSNRPSYTAGAPVREAKRYRGRY